MREELAVLEHQREAPLVGGYAGQVAASPGNRAPAERFQAGHRAEQGRLATAGRAEDREDLAFRQLEGDVGDRPPAVVGDGHPIEAEGRCAHQNAPTDGIRSRSTASTTSAVVPASTTDAASAMP